MEWLRDRKNRLTVSILAAMAAAILVAEDSGCRSIRLPLHGGEPCIRNFAFQREEETAPRKDFLLACGSAGMVI